MKKYLFTGLLPVVLFGTGIFLEFFAGEPTLTDYLPAYPLSVLTAVCYVIIHAIFFLIFRNSSRFRLLAGSKSAISAIIPFLFLVILMGFYRQTDTETTSWIHRIRSSWPFLLSTLYLNAGLLFTVMNRINTRPGLRNILFLCTHAGLCLIITAMIFGASDRREVLMEINKNNYVWYGSEKNKISEVPFAVKLQHFIIDFYSPKISLIRNEDVAPQLPRGKSLPHIETGSVCTLKEWIIHVKTFLPEAIRSNNFFIPACIPGSAPAAYTIVSNVRSSVTVAGWITPSVNKTPAAELKLQDNTSLILLPPAVQKYTSIITILTPDQKKSSARIQVNAPVDIGNWTLYQYSYDVSAGRHSSVSILQAVYEPWRKAVHIGILFLAAGATGMLLTKKIKKTSELFKKYDK